ncbi:L,D-transpeptidase family protein [Litoribacter ruber]|uniref:L,D-transpeptidase family protein n=1 Tax=Litoribacter ruber TaxID=702568 RepID=A0AAP2CFN3_9BACT|nr:MULTISPECIES: L,D-transpeptidase family protein [Litoribacter]MBS9522684.1 L,D-transpeptidase family protein [Litoribacter alkaliphilus]MBT0811213.1 L,D-transpeptidase family protein [Litoribacter ruber]
MSSLKYLVFGLLVLLAFSCSQYPKNEDIAEQLKEMSGDFNRDSLYQKVYSHNEFQPIWVKAQGVNKKGEALLSYLDEIHLEGLDKKDYLYDEIESLVSEIRETTDPEIHAVLDMMMSNSYWRLARDIDRGRVDPSKINIDWKIDPEAKKTDYYALLLDLDANKTSVQSSLDELKPENFRYDELKVLLKEALENNNGKNTKITFAGKIEPGDQHEAIPQIRKRMIQFQDLKDYNPEDSLLYDNDLEYGIRSFQARHGLNPDGVLGKDFIEAVNYQHDDYITKLKVNLERLRWLPNFVNGKDDKVIVNIPDFYLYYLSGEDTVFQSKVIVGKEYRQTPVFHSKMSYLVFSPTWTLPQTILWEDAIPAIQTDMNYLEKNRMQVLTADGEAVNPEDIEWKDVKEGEFPYMIQQEPGDHNSLGRVKFMFPNDYSIYIHDTPAEAYFEKDERTFSSGCIRIEKPVEFASLLLEDSDWGEEEITKAMKLEDEKNVNLNKNPEVWILYLTVWKDRKGVQVREDVYEGDRKLAEAMGLPVSNDFL